MSFVLNGTSIHRPIDVAETNSTQYAQQRALDGSVGRDLIGSNKRVWKLSFDKVMPAAWTTIKTIYDSYVSSGGTAVSWQVTEANYTVAATTVHVDIQPRGFNTPGSDFLSSFDLILTEA